MDIKEDGVTEPKSYQAIMVSSTFTDLTTHRRAVINAIQKFGFKPNVMEHDTARADADVIDTSLAMVRDSAGYVGIISRKYGQTPHCPMRNPDGLSLTELEFNEALRCARPILLFVMGEMHVLTEADVELDQSKRVKLVTFRDRAKRMGLGGDVERVYEVFESLEHFATAVTVAVGRLSMFLISRPDRPLNHDGTMPRSSFRPRSTLPLLAMPPYLASHTFVGRVSELQTITDWCGAADPNSILLFEAMGGSGKSMLTWEWLSNHSIQARDDWAGRLWYSFYERGAVMADFCRQALAYMTGQPESDFHNLSTAALAEPLLAELTTRPWLIVLDGIERILVAYHRHDAAQLREDEVDAASDPIGSRDPRAAIRPEDDDLLRRILAASPSKILMSSRLTPLALVNRSGLSVPGVRRDVLQGLRPGDAEAMMRACGITGDSQAIQAYLQTNCDCHPLVLGALAGLILDYPRGRGNFDRWVADPNYGAALNLGDLQLVQRQNHVLQAAIDALDAAGIQLLQTIALLQGGADFDTLSALNSQVEDIREGTNGDGERPQPAFSDSHKLLNTIRNLERRGLLQYELSGNRYDLHPVVRGTVAGRMANDEASKLGQRVFDYFSRQTHRPWEQAESLQDLGIGLQIVRVLLRMGRFSEALRVLREDLALALGINLNATAELQALLKSFFPCGWEASPIAENDDERSYLLSVAAICLGVSFPERSWMLREQTIRLNMARSEPDWVGRDLRNLAGLSAHANRLAEAHRLLSRALELAEATADREAVFVSKLRLFDLWTACGDYDAAEAIWREVEPLKRPIDRTFYRQGEAELSHAHFLFGRDKLTDEALDSVLALIQKERTPNEMQDLCSLRGEWLLRRGELALADKVLGEAVRLAREGGYEDSYAEALLVHARLREGSREEVRDQINRLSGNNGSVETVVAELWDALGDRDRATEHALRAHRWAVADGLPYVRRPQLARVRVVLKKSGAYLPEIAEYHPSQSLHHSWEGELHAFIAKMSASKRR